MQYIPIIQPEYKSSQYNINANNNIVFIQRVQLSNGL